MIPGSGGGFCGGDENNPVISQREIWLKQETVIIERVTRYVSIDGRGNINDLVETDRRLENVAHVDRKGDTGRL